MSKKSSTFARFFEGSTESVAQQVEHIPFKDGVLGSSPSWFTEQQKCCSFLFLCSILCFTFAWFVNFARKIT